MYVGTMSGMHYVDTSARVAYGFELLRLVGADEVRLDECVIGQVQVVAEEETVATVRERMRAWALATLAAGGYGFGRYLVSMGVLDDEDGFDPRCGHETIDWDGSRELAPRSVG